MAAGAAQAGAPLGNGAAQAGAGAAAPAQGNGQQPLYTAINVQTIVAHEGGNILTGYVPANQGVPIDNSGVTVGVGVDLGQQSAQGLLAMGVSQNLVSQLTPYLGQSGAPAQAALLTTPLTLTPAQATELNTAVMSSYFNAAATSFNAANNSGFANFAALPGAAQTVIADLWYNMGPLPGSAPNFWNQVTNGQWQGAYSNLMNFTNQQAHPALYNRAQQNAAILNQAIQGGSSRERTRAAAPGDS
jgi:hypothetical protein